MFDIIVAVSKNYVIGNDNKIPWNYKEDMKYFKKITTSGEKNVIVIGYNTWSSIGRVLPNRINIVLTRKANDVLVSKGDNLYYSNNFNKLIDEMEILYKDYNKYIIGGQQIYELALNI